MNSHNLGIATDYIIYDAQGRVKQRSDQVITDLLQGKIITKYSNGRVEEFPFRSFTNNFLTMVEYLLTKTATRTYKTTANASITPSTGVIFAVSSTTPNDMTRGILLGAGSSNTTDSPNVTDLEVIGLTTTGLSGGPTTVTYNGGNITFKRAFTNNSPTTTYTVKEVGLYAYIPNMSASILLARDTKNKDLTPLSITIAPNTTVEITYVFTIDSAISQSSAIMQNFPAMIYSYLTGAGVTITNILGNNVNINFSINPWYAQFDAKSSENFGLVIGHNSSGVSLGDSAINIISSFTQNDSAIIIGYGTGVINVGSTGYFNRSGAVVTTINSGMIGLLRRFTCTSNNVPINVGALYCKGDSQPFMIAEFYWDSYGSNPITLNQNEVFEGRAVLHFPYSLS